MLKIFTIILLSISSISSAALKTQPLEYKSGNDLLEGYLAYDDASTKPKGGILIVHDWMGLGDFAKAKADQLAKEGYVAFAVDIYGKGIRPKNSDEAGQLAGSYKTGDRAKLRAHIRAAYDQLIAMKQVNARKIVVMGYCFGGTTALELARSGANLAGTASFHGGLSSNNPGDAKNIKAPVLVMHGSDDPYVPASEVEAFKKEMKDAKVNIQFVAYKGTVHAFAIPSAGNDNSKGAAYNADADKKSWQEFEKFLKTVTSGK